MAITSRATRTSARTPAVRIRRRIGAPTVSVVVRDSDGRQQRRFEAQVRIDTPKEWEYVEHDGILHYVLRQLAA